MDGSERCHLMSFAEKWVLCWVCPPPWHMYTIRSGAQLPTQEKSHTFLCRNSSFHAEFPPVEVPPVEDCDQSKWVHSAFSVCSCIESKWAHKGSPFQTCNPPECSCFDSLHIASLVHNSMTLPQGNLLHDLVICLGLEDDIFLANCFISMYGSFSALMDACAVFDSMPIHNVVSWTALITCFVKSGHDREAVQLYEDMKKSGTVPNRICGGLLLCGLVFFFILKYYHLVRMIKVTHVDP